MLAPEKEDSGNEERPPGDDGKKQLDHAKRKPDCASRLSDRIRPPYIEALPHRIERLPKPGAPPTASY
jgi:hypothetical protein